ncbi:MAG: PH domain-containing protein [Kofleriaceae bacterium]
MSAQPSPQPFAPKTAADHWVLEQVRGHLDRDENMYAAAYAQTPLNGAGGIGAFVSAARACGYHMVLTDRRLIMVVGRLGAFGPLMENKDVTEIRFSDIQDVSLGRTLFRKRFNGDLFLRAQGKTRVLQGQRHDRYLSTTSAFYELLSSAEWRTAHAS